MSKNIASIDGVRYILSQADNKLLQTIKSRSSIEEDTSEKLTDTTVKRLIGHTDVLYYNLETRKWNSDCHHGHTVFDDKCRNHFEPFQRYMSLEPRFHQKYELVAPVIMIIGNCDVYKFAQLVQKPQPSKYGSAVVGNIIARNKITKKCELYGNDWVYIEDCDYPASAVFWGMNRFLVRGIHTPEIRAALVTAHTR